MESYSDRAYKNKIKGIQSLVAKKASDKSVAKAQMELESIGSTSKQSGTRVNLRKVILGVRK